MLFVNWYSEERSHVVCSFHSFTDIIGTINIKMWRQRPRAIILSKAGKTWLFQAIFVDFICVSDTESINILSKNGFNEISCENYLYEMCFRTENPLDTRCKSIKFKESSSIFFNTFFASVRISAFISGVSSMRYLY